MKLPDLLSAPPAEQIEQGYHHTLREICQQPETWIETAQLVARHRGVFQEALAGARSVVLTGSGSSLFAGETLALALQSQLGVPVQAIAGGDFLTSGARVIPPVRPCLVVSIARSGDSPESCAAVDLLLESEPDCRHLAITCNRNGRLANAYRGDPRVQAVTLAERTNDCSLVMTSSFTNMQLAARCLGMLDAESEYRRMVENLAAAARRVLSDHADSIADIALSDYGSAVYLASGCRFGAAREAALKMLEMTAGRVRTFPETYLGLRHGPMSAVHGGTLVICLLDRDPLARAYELDLIEELKRKQLGARMLILGDAIPGGLARSSDVALSCPELGNLRDDDAPVIDVLVGQLLAFFRCRAEGLKPDAPSESGVISRVVTSFRIHRAGAGVRP